MQIFAVLGGEMLERRFETTLRPDDWSPSGLPGGYLVHSSESSSIALARRLRLSEAEPALVIRLEDYSGWIERTAIERVRHWKKGAQESAGPQDGKGR